MKHDGEPWDWRAIPRKILSIARGTAFWIRHPKARDERPTVVLFPVKGPIGASLLRMYHVATGLRGLGWNAVLVPFNLTLAQRHRILQRFQPDLVLMQGVRHQLNRPQLYPGQRIVMDIDDADFHLHHLEAPMKAAMPEVALVLAGGRYVGDWCSDHGAPRVEVVWTGSPVSDASHRPQGERPKVIAWAQAKPDSYKLERAWVLDVVARLVPRHPDLTLRLYGLGPSSDKAILAPFEEAGIRVQWLPEMDYDAFLASFDDVALGLSPIQPETPFSRGKSFGKVLAYLDRKVPVIASDEAEHAAFFTEKSGVITNDPEEWARRADQLLSDAELRQAMADAAFEDYKKRLSKGAVSARVDRILRDLLSS